MIYAFQPWKFIYNKYNGKQLEPMITNFGYNLNVKYLEKHFINRFSKYIENHVDLLLQTKVAPFK